MARFLMREASLGKYLAAFFNRIQQIVATFPSCTYAKLDRCKVLKNFCLKALKGVVRVFLQ